MPCSSELLVSMDIPSTSIELSMLFSGLKGVLDPLLLFNRLLDVSILAKCMSIMGYEILNRSDSSLACKNPVISLKNQYTIQTQTNYELKYIINEQNQSV